MVTQIQSTEQAEIVYPDCDGEPMSDNTKQFRWIVTIKEGLEWLFKDDPNVFVAGDLLWYPVEGDNVTRAAPDAMVVLGRPKGDRGSYQQWRENNIAPQVVFEVRSPGNTQTGMDKKLVFYDRYGVEEYYLYDPDKGDLSGWLRREGRLDVIDQMLDWVSPRLGIKFNMLGTELQLYRPDGEKFATYVELATSREQEKQAKEQAQQQLEQEKVRSQQLAAKLRQLGFNPDEL